MIGPDEHVVDSPIRWVAKHIRAYVATAGRDGHIKWGVPNLLLTTRGRRSGRLRRTALIYGEDRGRYVVVACGSGEPHHPSWYLNLRANPEVYVQAGAETFPARASTCTGSERARLWRMMAELWPDYNRYEKIAKREIPVVVLERTPVPDRAARATG
jgi:deazaflavin-dependent oxidoreductase (nitroreductase family)